MHMPSYDCACCTLDVEETLSHLFLACPFAQVCWIKLNVIFVETDPFLALEEIKTRFNFHFTWMSSLFFAGAFGCKRNDYIFKGVPPSPERRSLQNFRKEFALVIV